MGSPGVSVVGVVLAAAAVSAQAGLTIVVVAGEDAVNVIQQRTAVPAVVEIRDRNNLPVAGASVTFKVGGQGVATFPSGGQTLSVVTDAAGRATTGALQPIGSGPLQIQVQATFQGQTATAVIEQTNVLTAAKGFSGLAIGGIAAGAGGAAAAVALRQQNADDGDDPNAPSGNCRIDYVNPFTMQVPAVGGTYSATFHTNCQLMLFSDSSWITITSPSTVAANSTFTITFVVAPNPTNMLRTGNILSHRGIGDLPGGFTVSQLPGPARFEARSSMPIVVAAGGCAYELTEAAISLDSGVSQAEVIVRTAASGGSLRPNAIASSARQTFVLNRGSLSGSDVAIQLRALDPSFPMPTLLFDGRVGRDGRSLIGTFRWRGAGGEVVLPVELHAASPR